MDGDELNTSAARLQRIDVDDLDDIIGCKERWVLTVKDKLKVEEEDKLTSSVFNSSSITKQKLAHWTGEAREIMTRQAGMISNLQEIVELMKTEALADKTAVIRLQSELLKSKDAELQSVKTAVQETVQTSVQAGIQTYSSAVTSNITAAPAFTPDILKKAVRTAIMEEDRSKNLLVFGLKEEDGESIEQVVDGLFVELGEKPRVQALNRLGGREKRSEGRPSSRPVKVTLASATSVSQILTKTGRLKQTQHFKSVYVCPDRSPTERAARKQLVVEMKKAVVEKPDLYHCIRGGKLCSMDKAES